MEKRPGLTIWSLGGAEYLKEAKGWRQSNRIEINRIGVYYRYRQVAIQMKPCCKYGRS